MSQCHRVTGTTFSPIDPSIYQQSFPTYLYGVSYNHQRFFCNIDMGKHEKLSGSWDLRDVEFSDAFLRSMYDCMLGCSTDRVKVLSREAVQKLLAATDYNMINYLLSRPYQKNLALTKMLTRSLAYWNHEVPLADTSGFGLIPMRKDHWILPTCLIRSSERPSPGSSIPFTFQRDPIQSVDDMNCEFLRRFATSGSPSDLDLVNVAKLVELCKRVAAALSNSEVEFSFKPYDSFADKILYRQKDVTDMIRIKVPRNRKTVTTRHLRTYGTIIRKEKSENGVGLVTYKYVINVTIFNGFVVPIWIEIQIGEGHDFDHVLYELVRLNKGDRYNDADLGMVPAVVEEITVNDICNCPRSHYSIEILINSFSGNGYNMF